MQRNRFYLDMALGAILGLVTGTCGSLLVPVAGGVFRDSGIGDIAYLLTVGMSFGLGLGILLGLRFGLAWWKGAVLTVFTPVLYYGAVVGGVMVHGIVDIGHELTVPGLIGGLVGGALVAVLTSLLARPVRWASLIAFTACMGALVGAIGLPVIDGTPTTQGMLLLHAPWHIGVLAVLVSGLGKRLGGAQKAG